MAWQHFFLWARVGRDTLRVLDNTAIACSLLGILLP